MGTVHSLLEAKGRRGALDAGFDRSIIEAAAAYLSDEDSGLGFAYSGWAQCALPHKRLADDAPWGTVSDKVRLMVEPGRRQNVSINGNQSFEFVGVPFGSHARLILLYLQTDALRTGRREVELGSSMRAWLARVGIPAGGTTGKSVRDQAERISRCKLTFDIATGSRSYGLVQQTIVDKALFFEADDGPRQGRLSLETAKLSEGFFEQFQKHPVPLEKAAIKALSNNAPALDAYLWLAYRLHVLQTDKLVTWAALKTQVGTDFSKLYHFKNKFPGTLALAAAVYPTARIEVIETGVVLKPSRLPSLHGLSPIGEGNTLTRFPIKSRLQVFSWPEACQNNITRTGPMRSPTQGERGKDLSLIGEGTEISSIGDGAAFAFRSRHIFAYKPHRKATGTCLSTPLLNLNKASELEWNNGRQLTGHLLGLTRY